MDNIDCRYVGLIALALFKIINTTVEERKKEEEKKNHPPLPLFQVITMILSSVI